MLKTHLGIHILGPGIADPDTAVAVVAGPDIAVVVVVDSGPVKDIVIFIVIHNKPQILLINCIFEFQRILGYL